MRGALGEIAAKRFARMPYDNDIKFHE